MLAYYIGLNHGDASFDLVKIRTRFHILPLHTLKGFVMKIRSPSIC